MEGKTYIPEGEHSPESHIGSTLEALASTIERRKGADEGSYTYRLLTGEADFLLKKVMEEAGEVALAAKDVEAKGGNAVDHLRYEAGDVVYHLLVVLARYGISIDEFAAELNNRMTEEERPAGAIRLREDAVRRRA